MSKETKTFFRIYTIADYDKEEIWLREMAMKGWMLQKVSVCIYTFERCEPEDIVFKLEFRETPVDADPEYMSILKDFGWEYLTSCNSFRYFFKKADKDERNNELFTDTESKLKMLRTIELRRLLPVTIIVLCCMLNAFRTIASDGVDGFEIFLCLLLALYIALVVRIVAGFHRLRKNTSKNRVRQEWRAEQHSLLSP